MDLDVHLRHGRKPRHLRRELMTKEQKIKAELRIVAVFAAMQLRGPSAALTLPAAVHTIGLIK